MNRRGFVVGLGAALAAVPVAGRILGDRSEREDRMTLFLSGDVMTGRGIDQVLPHSVDPGLHEPYVKTARRYVALAEEVNGEIPAPVSWDYIWGDALAELERVSPAARIINLETAVTLSDDWWPTKGIHYRMHPGNLPVLTAAGVDACVLGNNHVLDWGRPGLLETLASLSDHDIAVAGAGPDARSAREPAVLEAETGRILIFSWGTPGAGVPGAWAAGAGEPGVNVLPRLDAASAERVIDEIGSSRTPRDRVVASIHWGGNWGYDVPAEQREFAHRLIDSGVVDVIHGHSSHHPKGMEVYRDRLILYGAGDFLNDYEGIGGRAEFRGDLTLMYFPELDPTGRLDRLRMTPMRIRRFRLERPPPADVEWLTETMDRECRKLGTRVERTEDDRLTLLF